MNEKQREAQHTALAMLMHLSSFISDYDIIQKYQGLYRLPKF